MTDDVIASKWGRDKLRELRALAELHDLEEEEAMMQAVLAAETMMNLQQGATPEVQVRGMQLWHRAAWASPDAPTAPDRLLALTSGSECATTSTSETEHFSIQAP